MKVVYSWLKELVDVDATPEALAERLTFAGLEVEGVARVGSAYEGLVAGEITGIEKHPNADKLLICQVNNGKETLRVVCGAHNFKPGDKAPFAGIGTTLPNGMKIKAAKIRGEPSQGMLCAEDELGLSDDHTGLLILPADTPAGKPLVEILGPPETVLTIEVTPNRPDCLCLLGIAREVAALYGRRVRVPQILLPETGPAATECTSVQVKDPEGCPRYIARILHNIVIKPSPMWMRRRLTLAGIRPINNVVDITNYVMLECGQPLHAFDQTLLAEGRIVVRRAQAEERMPTLDGVERVLSPDLLVIADARQPVAVAGVMGGAASGILDTTRTVLLESACFRPALIRKGSKKLGLSTESSYRFERGVDIRMTEWASRRATALMVELAEGQAAKGAVDVLSEDPKDRKVSCRFDRVRRLLGLELGDDQIAEIFEALDLHVIDRDKKACLVQVPTFRPDLEREADLIEEVARIHGLDKIPMPAPRAQIVPGVSDAPVRAVMLCRNALVGLGLAEIMNYSFTSEALLNRFDASTANARVVLPRPISADHSLLRDSLLPQMGETLGRNRSRQIAEAALFEIGRVFFKQSDGKLCEEDRVAIGLMGPVGRSYLEKRTAVSEEDIFLALKGILWALGSRLGIKNLSCNAQMLEACVQQFPLQGFAPGRVVSIMLGDSLCGVMGLMKSELRKEWRILDPVALLEMRLAPWLGNVFQAPAMESLPVYPSVSRDMALKAPVNLKHAEILGIIRQLAPKELTGIELFDIYQGEEIGMGFKSMAYSLTYRSLDRTLTDEEVNTLHESIKAGLMKALNVEIRQG